MESKNDQKDVKGGPVGGQDDDFDILMKDSKEKPKINVKNDQPPIYSVDVEQSNQTDLEYSKQVADRIIIGKSNELSENIQYVCFKMNNKFQIINYSSN